MKKLLAIIGLTLTSLVSVAQLNYNAKSIYFTNADSATVRSNAAACGNCGFIYYNKQHDQPKFRVYQDSVWYDLLGSAGSVTSLTNGLTKTGSVGKLGGNLTQYTYIDGAASYGLCLGCNTPITQFLSFSNTNQRLQNDMSGVTSRLDLNTGGVQFETSVSSMTSGISVLTGGGLAVIDGIGLDGLFYDIDYSTTQIKGNRWIADKGYIDSHLQGLTFTNSPSNGNVPTFNGTNWTYSTPGGGTPAGSNTQVQFNSSGSFGADADFYYDPTYSQGALNLVQSADTEGLFLRNTSAPSTNYLALTNSGIISTNNTGTGFQIHSTNAPLSIYTDTNTSGNGRDVTVQSGSTSNSGSNGGNLILDTGTGAGTGKNGSIRIPETANCGTAILVGGTVTVNLKNITANSRIFLTSQIDGGTVGFLRVSARTAGTSFTVTSSSAIDTSTIAYLIIEP